MGVRFFVCPSSLSFVLQWVLSYVHGHRLEPPEEPCNFCPGEACTDQGVGASLLVAGTSCVVHGRDARATLRQRLRAILSHSVGIQSQFCKGSFYKMAEFICRLGTPAGEVITRTVEAPGVIEARAHLEREGFRVFNVTPPKTSGVTALTRFGRPGSSPRVKAPTPSPTSVVGLYWT